MTALTFTRTLACTFACSIAFALAHPAPAQVGLDSPAKSKSYVIYTAQPQSVPAGKRAVVELHFQLVPGFHVNSHTPKSALLIPTVLTLQSAPGVTPGDLVYPPGKLFSFSFDPSEKVDVYEGAFTVHLPVVATAGDHIVDATLKYQACDNASCYPPRTLPVKIVFTAK
jgi:hypothetical protein